MLLNQTNFALLTLILTLFTLHIYGRPLQIQYFFSRSFIPDALKIDYDVREGTKIYYNVTAFRPFPGRLMMNFFIRQYGAEKGMPSKDFLKRSYLDFCKTLELLRNATCERRIKPFLLQDTFVTACPLVNGFYYIRNGIIPSEYVPFGMGAGRYVVHFELLQVIDELVKLMNLRFVAIVEEGDNAGSGDDDDNDYDDNDDDGHHNENDSNDTSSDESNNKNADDNEEEDNDSNNNGNGDKNHNNNDNNERNNNDNSSNANDDNTEDNDNNDDNTSNDNNEDKVNDNSE